MPRIVAVTQASGRRTAAAALQNRFQSIRTAATQAQKREGDISDAFASLSGLKFKPLDPRFAKVKENLIAGHEDAVKDSFHRLLARLRNEIPLIASLGSKVVPQIDFGDLDNPSAEFSHEYRKRGVAVVRNVIPEPEMMSMKQQLKDYLAANPQTKAFPKDNPQVYELYWSPAQIRARSHPNLLKAQRFVMSYWHSKDPNALVSTDHPTIYADRLRMRTPGDNAFALGPHVDGGSCERWEPEGYGQGGVYDAIWKGKWEEYDPWESSCRLPVQSDLYQGVGSCSMFRMSQGWVSMSKTGPHEGTLLVNPLLQLATAYYLLRPFFSPRKPAPDATGTGGGGADYSAAFLADDNWSLNKPQDSWLHGATLGRGQELDHVLHPHLNLPQSMVHIGQMRPGDAVFWHCDQIHAVDKVHQGATDSSVFYIPACPLTVQNAQFLARQRDTFLRGVPCPDFGGGVGESEHVGRQGFDNVREASGKGAGVRAFGLEDWDGDAPDLSPAQRELINRANKELGFHM